MVRKQILITADQNKRLKVYAATAGVSEAELVRAGIDMYLARQLKKLRAWQQTVDETLSKLSGAWAERADLDKTLAQESTGLEAQTQTIRSRMNKMVRQQLFITAEQKRRIKTRSALTGMSVGEIIRRGIDRELAQESASAEGDWKDAWRQAFGMWADYDEIDEIMVARRKRNRLRMERIRKQMRGK